MKITTDNGDEIELRPELAPSNTTTPNVEFRIRIKENIGTVRPKASISLNRDQLAQLHANLVALLHPRADGPPPASDFRPGFGSIPRHITGQIHALLVDDRYPDDPGRQFDAAMNRILYEYRAALHQAEMAKKREAVLTENLDAAIKYQEQLHARIDALRPLEAGERCPMCQQSAPNIVTGCARCCPNRLNDRLCEALEREQYLRDRLQALADIINLNLKETKR